MIKKQIHFLFYLLLFCINSAFPEVLKKYSDEIIAYYDFDQTKKNDSLEDRLGRKNGRILNNKSFWVENGVYGGAGNFTGNNSVVVSNVRQISKGRELTIMMWVKPSSVEGRVKLISKRSYDNEFNYFLIGLDKGKPYAALGDGENLAVTPKTKTLKLNTWYHLALVLNRDNFLKLYINGKLSEEVETLQEGYYTLDAKLSIGADFEGEEAYYQGLIDDCVILEEALDGKLVMAEAQRSDILLLKNVTDEMIINKPEMFLKAYWQINDGRGAKIENVINGDKIGLIFPKTEMKWQSGFLKDSLMFNGKNTYIKINSFQDINLTRSFSLICWIKPDDIKGMKTICYKGDFNNKHKFYKLLIDKGNLIGGFGDGTQSIISTNKIPVSVNKWQQISLLFNHKSKICQILLNGEVKDSFKTSFNVLTGTTPLLLGWDSVNNSSFFSGSIADVKLYNVSLPVKLIKQFYEEVDKKISILEVKRAKLLKIKNKLKKAFQELNELNDLLGKEDQINNIPGKEEATLKKVELLIKQRLKEVENRKKQKINELTLLKKEINSKITKLNSLLEKLKQPQFEKKMPEITTKTSIDDLINYSADFYTTRAEVELAIKQKLKEIELKENLLKKKRLRYKAKIIENLKIINKLATSLAKPAVSIDNAKVNQDIEKYSKEVEVLLAKLEKEKENKIKQLKKGIQQYRGKIKSQLTELKVLARFLNKTPPKEVDLTSPLVDNIDKLTRIYNYEEIMIKKLQKRIDEYKVLEKQNIQKEIKKLQMLIDRIYEKKLQLEKVQEKLGESKITAIKFPAKKVGDIKTYKDVAKTMKLNKEFLRKLDNLLDTKNKLYLEKHKAVLRKENIKLKNEFKEISSKLIKINKKLKINEKWSIPEGSNLEEINKRLSEINSNILDLFTKRTVLMEKIKKEKSLKRKKILEEIKVVSKELNEQELFLGLKKTIAGEIKEGSESDFLDSMKAELNKRKNQVAKRKKMQALHFERNKQKWNDLSKQLKILNQKLGVADTVYSFNKKSILKDIQELELELQKKQKLITERNKKIISQAVEKNSKAKDDSKRKINSLVLKLRTDHKKLSDINNELNKKTKPLPEFVWEKHLKLGLYSYYKFDKKNIAVNSVLATGNILFLKNFNESFFRQGKYKTAPYFNGRNQHGFIDISDLKNADITMLFWMKPAKLVKNQVLLKFIKDDKEGFFSFNIKQSSLFLEFYNEDELVSYDTSVVLNANEWNHLTIVLSKGSKRIKVYQNGQYVWSKRLSMIADGFSDLFVAGSNDNITPFAGLFDELKIYSKVIDSDQLLDVGLEIPDVSLKDRITFLEKHLFTISTDLKKKTSLYNKLQEENILKEQRKKEQFNSQLKALNEYLKKLGDLAQTEADFANWDKERKLDIVASRLRRAKKRFNLYQDQLKEKRNNILDQIQKERIKLKALYQKIGETGTLFDDVPHGKEDQILNQIQQIVQEKEKIYQIKLKDKKQKLAYINSELTSIYQEMATYAIKLKMIPPKKPVIKSYTDDDILLKSRKMLSDLKIKYKEYEEKRQKRYAKLSAEIEQVWEQLMPVCKELHYDIQKPVYKIDSAEKVLVNLKKIFKEKSDELSKIKLKKQAIYNSSKKELNKVFEQLKEFAVKLGQKIEFEPDFSEKNITSSLDFAKTLLKDKQNELRQLKSKQLFEQKKLLNSLIQNNTEKALEYYSVLKELDEDSAVAKLAILENKPKGLIKLFQFDQIYNNVAFDAEISTPMFLNDIKNITTSDETKSSSLLFNGKSSYAKLDLQQKTFKDSFVNFFLSVKPDRLWQNKSILYLETGENSGVDIFFEKDVLNIRKIVNNVKTPVVGGIKLNTKETINFVVEFDLVNNFIQLKQNEKNYAKIKLSSAHVFQGKIRLGSFNMQNDFFSGQIFSLMVAEGILSSSDRNNITKLKIIEYTKNATKELKMNLSKLGALVKTSKGKLVILKQKRKEKREKFLQEIESLKADLAKYTNQEKIIFSVIIGKEEQALKELKQKVNSAKLIYEKQQKEQQIKFKQKMIAIKNKEEILKELIKKIGSKPFNIKLIKGKEDAYIKKLDQQLKVIKKEKIDKEILIRQNKNLFKRLHLQYGTKEEEIPYPQLSDGKSLNQYNKELKNLTDEIQAKINEKDKNQLYAQWNELYALYRTLTSEVNEKFVEIKSGDSIADIQANIINVSEKIASLKDKKKIIEAREKERILKNKNIFEEYLSKLKPILHELGQKDLLIGFNQKQSDQSVKNIKKIFKLKTNELEKKKQKLEAEKAKQLQGGVTQLLKAIEEEKKEISKYVKELKLSKYELPSILDSGKKIKGLFNYFKLDKLSSSKIVDSMENLSSAYVSNYTKEIKTSGKYGFAIALNGFDQLITIPFAHEIKQIKQLTIALWLYSSRTYGKRNLFCSSSKDKKNSLFLSIVDGEFVGEIKINNNLYRLKSSFKVPRKAWVHLALAIDKNVINLYGDGAKVASTLIPKSSFNALGDNLIIGSDYFEKIDLFSGKIDEIKIYQSALDSESLKNVMEESIDKAGVSDPELLREEYEILRDESRKLAKQVKELIRKEEEKRYQKVIKINNLIDEISKLNLSMNKSSFDFIVTTGNEDAAIEELKQIFTETAVEFKEFKKKQLLIQKEHEKKFKDLKFKIIELHGKLGIEKEYVISKSSMESDKEVLKRATLYYHKLKAQYAILKQDQKEEQKLEIEKDIHDYIFRINEIYEVIGIKKIDMSIFGQESNDAIINKLKNMLKEAESKLNIQIQNNQSKENEYERDKIIKSSQNILRKIESIQNKLNIDDDMSLDKKDDPNVRVYLNFDEGKGNFVKDQTIYGNRGLFYNQNFEWIETGYFNKCVGFTGRGEGLKIYESQSLNEVESFSILFWINVGNLNKDSNIITIGDKENSKLSLNIQDERLITGIGSDVLVDTGVTLKKDHWQHIGMVFNKDQKLVSIYADGALVSESSYSKQFKSSILINNPIIIASSMSKHFFKGFIDEFKLFSVPLHDEDIKDNMREGILKINTVLAEYSLEQARSYKVKLEQKLLLLQNQYDKQVSINERKQKQWEQEYKFLEQAKRKKNINTIKNLILEINVMKEKMNEAKISYIEPEEGDDEKMLGSMKDIYFETVSKINKGLVINSIVQKYPLNEKFVPDNKLFCRIEFDKLQDSLFEDSSILKQEVSFSTNPKKWLVKGVTGQAVKLGNHGYLKITANGDLDYKLRQSVKIWINPDKSALSNSPLLSRGNFHLNLINGGLQVSISEEVIGFSELEQIKANQWNLITLNINEFSSKIQMGLGNDIGVAKSFSSRLIDSQGAIYIGGSPENPKRFNGLVDDVSIYNRLLFIEDYKVPFIYNKHMKGSFSLSSIQTVYVNIDAKNVDFMRVYQLGRISTSTWEKYRKYKLLDVTKMNRNEKHVTVVAELKNSDSDKAEELSIEIPIPELKNVDLFIPPESVELTTR